MIFAAGFVIAFVILLIFNMKNSGRRQCRWRERRGAGQSEWMCIHCGARVSGEKGVPPGDCHRENRV